MGEEKMAKRKIHEWAFAALDLYIGGKEAGEVAAVLNVEPGEVRRVMAYFKNADPQILEGGYRSGDPEPKIVNPQALEEARRNGSVIEAKKSRSGAVAKEKAIPVIQGKTNDAIQGLQEQYEREIQELRRHTEKAIQELREQYAEVIAEIQSNTLSPTEVEQLRALLMRAAPAERQKGEKKAVMCRLGMKPSLALWATVVFGGLAVLVWKKGYKTE